MLNILLAEDDDALRSLLSLMLSQSGYSVLEASDGVDALTTAKRHTGSIDLLCANMACSRLDGVSLAEQLKTKHPQMKVIMLVTANRNFVKIARARAAQHPDYAVLEKPFSLEQFAFKVDQVLGRARVSAAPPA